MRVVVFRARVKDGVGDAYAGRAERVAVLAQQVPGFVASKDFVAEDGERVAIIEFRGAEEFEAWRNHPEHRAARTEGRARFYDQYSLQVCELLRESRFVAGDAAVAPTATTDFDVALSPHHESYEGGCFCGANRYRAAGRPRFPSVCHCTICRRTSGAPMVAWATFRTEDLEWLTGQPKRFVSSLKGERSFCADCGAALTFRFNASPEWTDVTLATLDRPSSVSPLDHTFAESKIPWVRLADGLPQFPSERPR